VSAGGRRRQGFALALAVLAGAAQCGTTGQPPPAHAFPVQEFTLPSGLKVVIEQDDVSSIAGIVVVVDAGSVDDPAGAHGMAHVLEHLVFRVRDGSGDSLQRRLIRLGAASFNATTGVERTTYYAFGPRQTLDEMVALVLDRLADPLRGAKEADVAKETSITAEEMRKREGAAGYEFLMPALLQAGDPVGRAYREFRRSDPLSLAGLRSFADTFYRPERMTVVISGPIAMGWEKTLLAKLPPALRGDDARRRAPVRRAVAPFAAPPPADGELRSHKAKVDVPELWMAWRVPPGIGVDENKLYAVAQVIQIVLSSRLEEDGTNDVLDVDGLPFTGSLAAAVGCRFKLRAAGDGVRIRNETKAALEGLSDATMVHIKGRLRWSNIWALQAAKLHTALGMDTLQGRALARADLAHSGASALISNVLAALEKVTVDDLTEFATRYLKPEAARAVLVVPEEVRTARSPPEAADGDNAVILGGTETEIDQDQDDDGKDAGEDLPDKAKLLATTQIPNARTAVVRKLTSGLTVIAMRRPGLPFVSMTLGFHADPQLGDAPGARYAYEHVLHMKLSEWPLELGLLRYRRHHADETRESLRMFSASLDKALDFLSEEADSLHVYWPNTEFQRWLDETAVVEATPEGRASRAFRAALFGNHLYRLTPTTAEMRALSEPQVQAWLDRVRRPANGALIVVGEIDPEGAIRDAERMLHGWKGDASPLPPPPAAPVTRADLVIAGSGARTIFTEDSRRRSADVRFGCFLPPVRAPRDTVVSDLLAMTFRTALYRQLRWKLAVSYSVDVDDAAVRGGTSWLNGRLDVDARALPAALELLHTWLDDGASPGIDDKLFQELRWQKARRSGLMNATGQELSHSLFEAWNMGWDPAVLDDYPRDLASVTAADLDAAMTVCRKTAVISVLGPGPIP